MKRILCFSCNVRKGGLRDAVLFSCGANAAHGVRRTNEDKRRAVMKLLLDAEWSHWSDREIAETARVAHPFVAKLRAEIAPIVTGNISSERTYTNKHGSVSRMNTSAIGRREPSSHHSEVEQIIKFGATPERAAEIARENANAHISAALWEIERRIDAQAVAAHAGSENQARRVLPL